MLINKITPANNNKPNFNARYKIPMTSEKVEMFEKHVVPLYKEVKKEPIKGFYANKLLHVFTGKEDVAFFLKQKPKHNGVVITKGTYNNSDVVYDSTQYATSPFENIAFNKKMPNNSFKPLENLNDLISKLF